MELIDVVSKLVGPIQPIGSAAVDRIRKQNLGEMIELADQLLTDIRRVAACSKMQQASMKEAGKQAQNFLDIVMEG